MAFNYKPLWKLLIDKDMTKKEFMQKTGISKSTVDKMRRGRIISLEILDRICTYFNCPIENVIQHIDCKEGDRHE
jgi:DNA-binding Xre family transcriptional regulator